VGIFDSVRDANLKRKIEKENRALHSTYLAEIADWEASKNVAQKMLSSFQSLEDGEDAVSSNAVMKKGNMDFGWVNALFMNREGNLVLMWDGVLG